MYEVVWPRSRRTSGDIPLAKRLDTLNGKTIGGLWNGLFRGDEILRILKNELSKKFPGVKFVNYDEIGLIHGMGEGEFFETLGQRLRDLGCDAVISTSGC